MTQDLIPDFTKARWLNRPKIYEVADQFVTMTTEPGTDFWQGTYSSLRNDNAPALLLESRANFTFTIKTSFNYRGRFDQAGLLIYLDSENWFKASVELEDESLSRLGSVVTNHGYSDWASTNIPMATVMWYRLSRRGPDFRIEAAPDGKEFAQMRIFHLHVLGATVPETSDVDPPAPAQQAIRFGLYACSPLDSAFGARFEEFQLEECFWLSHNG